MKKILICMVVAGAFVVGGLIVVRNPHSMTMSIGSSGNVPSQDLPNQVLMQGLDFKTKRLSVKKGTTITWKNLDDAMHNIAFDSGPGKAGSEGELFGRDKTYSVTFDQTGTYNYHCRPHPYMKASIEVTE